MDASSGLKTDLYELTMAAGYLRSCPDTLATFELYCHGYPEQRSFYLAAGLQQAVEYLQNLKFGAREIALLKHHPVLKSAGSGFFNYLKKFRFSGDVWAVPEGTPFFPGEPIMTVRAPIIQAQIVETYLLSVLHLQTLVATKAARVVSASSADNSPRQVVDFGARRAHGPQAAVYASRAAFIGGCSGTSNVYAGLRFGIPTFGTMAHSWVSAFESEEEAFKNYYRIFPGNAVFLIDTYDTLKAARNLARLKIPVSAVRLDSGDLLKLSRAVRKILDNAGLKNCRILASGNLDEYKIAQLVKAKAPIDIFGVGTELATSGDLPNLELVYKLVETETKGRRRFIAKCSSGKQTLTGRKQIYRYFKKSRIVRPDVLALAREKPLAGAKPLLRQVMKKGKLSVKSPALSQIRGYAAGQIRSLPEYCRLIRRGRYLEVNVSQRLREEAAKICPGQKREKNAA